MPDNFKYEVNDADSNSAVLKLDKEVLGGPDAIAFRSSVDEFVRSDKNKLIIDLADVELMNSTGLGMLISAYSSLRKADKSLKLINIPEKVMTLLKLTKLDSILI